MFWTSFLERRKTLGISQNDIANHLGVSPQAVSKWEKGTSLPDITLLGDIASYLHVPIDYFLTGKIANGYLETDEHFDIDEFTSYLIFLRKLNNLTQSELANLIGTSYQTISKWEKGDTLPSIDYISKCARIYQISFSDLYFARQIKNHEKKKERNIENSIIPTPKTVSKKRNWIYIGLASIITIFIIVGSIIFIPKLIKNIKSDLLSNQETEQKAKESKEVFYNIYLFDLDQTIQVSNKQTSFDLPTLTKEDYTFLGWYSENNIRFYTDVKYPYDKDITLYAKFIENKVIEPDTTPIAYYTIYFPEHGLRLRVSNKQTSYTTPNPIREGFTFVSWVLEDGTEFDTKAKYPYNHDITLMGKYKKNLMKIIFRYDNKEITKSVYFGGNLADVPEVPKKQNYDGKWSIDNFTFIVSDLFVNPVYTPYIYDNPNYVINSYNINDTSFDYSINNLALNSNSRITKISLYNFDDVFIKELDETNNHINDLEKNEKYYLRLDYTYYNTHEGEKKFGYITNYVNTTNTNSQIILNKAVSSMNSIALSFNPITAIIESISLYKEDTLINKINNQSNVLFSDLELSTNYQYVVSYISTIDSSRSTLNGDCYTLDSEITIKEITGVKQCFEDRKAKIGIDFNNPNNLKIDYVWINDVKYPFTDIYNIFVNEDYQVIINGINYQYLGSECYQAFTENNLIEYTSIPLPVIKSVISAGTNCFFYNREFTIRLEEPYKYKIVDIFCENCYFTDFKKIHELEYQATIQIIKTSYAEFKLGYKVMVEGEILSSPLQANIPGHKKMCTFVGNDAVIPLCFENLYEVSPNSIVVLMDGYSFDNKEIKQLPPIKEVYGIGRSLSTFSITNQSIFSQVGNIYDLTIRNAVQIINNEGDTQDICSSFIAEEITGIAMNVNCSDCYIYLKNSEKEWNGLAEKTNIVKNCSVNVNFVYEDE